jgi:ABC-type phosphate transport system auxiliary subunit
MLLPKEVYIYDVHFQELENLKKIKIDLEEKLDSEANQYVATEKHNIQLNNLVQQLKDNIAERETEIELGKGNSVT